ncbi:FAD binding domain-containing protein, partial [Nocardioides hankookensis]
MDLVTVTSHRLARGRDDLTLATGETLLAGGTWLFSEPQPEVSGLVDLTTLGWPDWEELPGVLRIGATCTIERVLGAPWGPAASLVSAAADSFLMSWKVQHLATVGGNLALALPAGAMVSLTAGLGASVEVWTPDGGSRVQPVADLVTGAGTTTLLPGEVIRA